MKIFYLGGGFGRSGTPVVEEGKSYGDLLAYKWATDSKGNRIVTAFIYLLEYPVATGKETWSNWLNELLL